MEQRARQRWREELGGGKEKKDGWEGMTLEELEEEEREEKRKEEAARARGAELMAEEKSAAAERAAARAAAEAARAAAAAEEGVDPLERDRQFDEEFERQEREAEEAKAAVR